MFVSGKSKFPNSVYSLSKEQSLIETIGVGAQKSVNATNQTSRPRSSSRKEAIYDSINQVLTPE